MTHKGKKNEANFRVIAPSTQELCRLRRRRPSLPGHAPAARGPLAVVPLPHPPAGPAGISEGLGVGRLPPLVLVLVVLPLVLVLVLMGLLLLMMLVLVLLLLVLLLMLLLLLLLRSSIAPVPAPPAACSLLPVHLVTRVFAEVELGEVLAKLLHTLWAAAASGGLHAVHHAVGPLGRLNLTVMK